MADPYNPYATYPTPTPGGVGYYPPEENAQQPAYPSQQAYGNAEPQRNPNFTYAQQPSPYHLAPEPYQGGAPDRSYTPVEQVAPVPLGATGMPPAQGKVPENLGY